MNALLKYPREMGGQSVDQCRRCTSLLFGLDGVESVEISIVNNFPFYYFSFICIFIVSGKDISHHSHWTASG